MSGRGGPRPNSGPAKGSKQKRTIAREKELAAEAERSRQIEEANAERAAAEIKDAIAKKTRLGKEILSEFANVLAGMAAFYQPAAPGQEATKPNGDEKKFKEYAELAIYASKEVAKYESYQFRAVQVAASPGGAQPGDNAKPMGDVIDISNQTAVARTYREIMQAPAPKRIAAPPAAKETKS